MNKESGCSIAKYISLENSHDVVVKFLARAAAIGRLTRAEELAPKVTHMVVGIYLFLAGFWTYDLCSSLCHLGLSIVRDLLRK